MTFKLADRVKETTTTAGISNVVLGGAYDGYQTFADAIGNAHKTYYVIVDNSNNNWEVGIGTYHSTGNILSRDVVLESSNSDDKISLTGGTSDVFVSYPAEKVVCLNPDSFVSGVAFSGYAFPDGTTQTSAAVEISDTSNLPNAIAIWSDSSALTKDAGFQFITDKFVNNHPTEMNVLSGIPLTITRYASGNFFEAYIDNANDRTLALNLTDEASPTWKLGLKNDPSNNLPPEYGYTYGSNGSAGQAATSDTYTTINYSNGLWFTHKSSNLFNFDKTNGGVIYNATASAPAFTVKGAAAQSANLQEWKNVSDTVVAYLEPDGSISGNALRVSGIIFPDGTTQATTAADGAFSVASGVIQLNLINTNTANITTNADNIVASGTSIIDSSTALTIASGTSIRSGVLSNTTSIGGNTGSITVNRDNIVASGTAIINSYTDLVIASGTAERDLTVASGTSIIGQFSSKADLNSPAFAGTPTAPTAAALTNTTQIATTAFVRTEVTNLVDSAPGTLDTLNELAAALGDDANFSTTVTNSLATKATVNNLAGASGALQKDIDLLYASGDSVSGIAFAAYGWGNHASVGYASPTDFALLYASGADTSGIAFDAYARGDHRTLGLVTHSTFGSEGLIKRGSSSGVYTAITDNSSNWNTAYSWGDHTPSGTKHARQIDMLAGSGVDTSGIAFDSYAWGDHRTLGLVTHATFGSEGLIKRGSTSGSYSFITDNSSNWNTAYGWGDHSSAGYLTTATFINGSGTSERAATIASGTKLRKDIDLVFASGDSISGIAFGAYAWGDHSSLGLVTHATFGSEGIIKRGSTSGSYSFITDNSSNWNTAYGWGDHGSAGYLTTATFINGSGTAERAATIASGTAIRSEIKTYTATSGLELHGATAFAVGISGDNLLSTNDPVNSYVPSFNASTRKFTWVENAGGGGGGGAVSAVANGADNRLVTFSSSDALNGEANLIFDGSQLTVSGEITATTLDIGGIDVTSTAAELNILDGVTSTTAELNILDGVTSTTAELNILDGVTSTTAELNIVDGDTAATSTTLADADRVVVNDGGTMKQVALTDFETYFESALDTLSNVTSVGALDAGSITSNFGTINTGASAITTTGLITGGSLDIDDVVINGATIGHTDDADLITLANGRVTVDGEISVTTLDIGGTNVTSTAAELNILDGVTSTAAELNIMDAGATVTTPTVAGGDAFVMNDADVGMRQVDIDNVDTYLAATTKTLTNKTLTSPDINTPDIDGGTIDNCEIGKNVPSSGTFTTLKADSFLIGSTEVTATAAELNILDGVTASTSELNKLDGAFVDATELNYLEITTLGTAEASRAVTVSAGSKITLGSIEIEGSAFDIDGGTIDGATIATSNITVGSSKTLDVSAGTLTTSAAQKQAIVSGADGATIDNCIIGGSTAAAGTFTSITIGSTLVTATAAELNILDGVTSTTAELNILDGVTSTTAELNILDGVTSTAAELNIMDGDTAATSTTLADADRVVVNDNGTMKQVALTDFETYFEGALDTLNSVTSASALATVGTITTGVWNGTAIATAYIADDAITGAKIALFDDSLAATSTHFLIADGTDYSSFALSGDVTCTNAGVVTIADNAITLAKLAGGTDGTIITFDANGDPVAVGPGTDGQVLTSTGVGSPPAFEDASGGAVAAVANV